MRLGLGKSVELRRDGLRGRLWGYLLVNLEDSLWGNLVGSLRESLWVSLRENLREKLGERR